MQYQGIHMRFNIKLTMHAMHMGRVLCQGGMNQPFEMREGFIDCVGRLRLILLHNNSHVLYALV